VISPSTPTPLPTLSPGETPIVSGLSMPVAGACLPSSDDLMPGAPRPYRDGTHEGVDFYDSDNCTPMGEGTEILAVKAGTVVRADLGYQDLTPEELAELEARVANGEEDDPDLIDAFRGRQVWVDHGGGLVTRYCHLDSIAEEIAVGTRVAAGEVVGYMGQSGEPESVTAPGTQVHLHFEVRVGDTYLGAGLPADVVRTIYEEAFAP
jgi:murein DD-endopeptidase MepM/ murein hydrolase activator NlpD